MQSNANDGSITDDVCVLLMSPQVLGVKAADTAAADPNQPPAASAAGPLNMLGTNQNNQGSGGSSSSSGRTSGAGSNAATTSTATTSTSSSSSVISQDSAASALDQIMLAAARWVAHLPVVGHSWLGRQQQSRPWAVHADVVHMAAAGPEEHAHLLAGFFLQLGQQVCVGTGLRRWQLAAACNDCTNERSVVLWVVVMPFCSQVGCVTRTLRPGSASHSTTGCDSASQQATTAIV